MNKRKWILGSIIIICTSILMWIFGEHALYITSAWMVIWTCVFGNGDDVFFHAILKNSWATRADIAEVRCDTIKIRAQNDVISGVYAHLYKCQEEHKLRMQKAMNKETDDAMDDRQTDRR